jgi:hypothetical protein
MRKTKELLRLRFELGLGSGRLLAVAGWECGRSTGIWNGWGRDRLAVAGRLERRGSGSQAIREPAGPGEAERGRHNRTGKLVTKLDVLRNGRCCKSILGGLILNFL